MKKVFAIMRALGYLRAPERLSAVTPAAGEAAEGVERPERPQRELISVSRRHAAAGTIPAASPRIAW
jgi:hypothetical protein